MRSLEVLLVEDNPGDTHLIERTMQERSLPGEVHAVRTGTDALEWLHGRGEFADTPRPDLVLLDLNLPARSGHEVLEEITAESGLRSIPVVVLTGSRSDSDIERAYERGANACLVKPVDPDAFGDLVESVIAFWARTARLPPTES